MDPILGDGWGGGVVDPHLDDEDRAMDDVPSKYFELLADRARQFVEEDRTARDIMHRGMDVSSEPDLVKLRVQLLTQQDHERVGGYMASGCFSGMEDDDRLAAFVVCFELDDEISKLDVHRRFEPYNQAQPLFVQAPKLWPAVRGAELVATTRARHLRRSGLVEVPGGWGRLDAFLAPELLVWVEDTFPELPVFVRLDPWFAADVQPMEPLREAAIRPARPGWWNTLALRNREKEGAHYFLQATEADLPAKVDEFYEHHIRGVLSLEVHAERSKTGNLSMMLEELSMVSAPTGD